MNANFKKIRCPHCHKKILATLGTANFCPNCHKPVTIEFGFKYICKDCKHKFRSREVPGKLRSRNLRCPKCGSFKIKEGGWIGRIDWLLDGL
jgi:DNA-directed RNA polymerase subunit RPC12/RpoP